MKIFISWSGSLSKSVALDLKDWLPKVIQVAEPWVSEVDIPKGTAWFDEVRNALKSAAIGIFVVTPESAESVWLNYEAGSIAQILTDKRVCPFVVGMTKTQVKPPLGLLNGTEAKDKQDVLNFLLSVAPEGVKHSTIEHAFGREWSDFELLLRRRIEESRNSVAPPPTRTMEDKVDEILGLARSSKSSRINPFLLRAPHLCDVSVASQRMKAVVDSASGEIRLEPLGEDTGEEEVDPVDDVDRMFEAHLGRALDRHLGGEHRDGDPADSEPD